MHSLRYAATPRYDPDNGAKSYYKNQLKSIIAIVAIS